MHFIQSAVDEGMRCGTERAAAKHCSGSDDPDRQCPMPTTKGCFCAYVAYSDLPWWRRIFAEKPKRPSEADVISGILNDVVEHTISERDRDG